MRTTTRRLPYTVVASLIVLAAASGSRAGPSTASDSATTRPTIESRIAKQIQDSRVLGAPPALMRAMDERMKILRALTPKDLSVPRLVPSIHFPDPRTPGQVMVFVWWIEDQPSMTGVRVTNPATGVSYLRAFRQSHIDENTAIADGGVVFSAIVWVPIDILGNDSRAELHLSVTGLPTTAPVYRSER